ncbi:hypothetical protein PTTG_11977 [Puccinia triticina 1-1 BBBD Race 1]|uniref:Uncharacterized protein n=2 Tax=Puccinia triticina TaxID=208348 RepID=A0A180GNI0_PUCT1|nr:uncharacterized protein PtA15_1A945 [Puccinia triticina]OAV94084.1 hypothetical protein PTTG_11977 [Puccinia triticina 1-1 BBBD Race 1]WAQ81603.1 hypothetical protein PtA15_1A945 [Puccinia triticina]WAR52487.1 hypothetical protein PtB15_1B929 [Puccinia triticina]
MDIPEQWIEEHEGEPQPWMLEFDQEAFDRDPVQWMREHAHEINDTEPILICSLALPRDPALLVTAFEDLIGKTERCIDEFYDNQRRLQVSSDFSSHSRQIEKILLPSLRDKLSRVCDILFGPAHFEQIEPSKFQAGLKALKEVEGVVDHIFTSMTSFWLPSDPAEMGPANLPDVTSYRGEFTQTKMLDLMESLSGLFQIYGGVLHISMRVSDMRVGHYGWRKLINDTHIMRDYIDDVVKWLGLSDLGVLQEEWRTMAQEADHLIQDLGSLPVFKSYQRLQQDFLSLVKISRLFYKTISKANKTKSHPISEMPPIQLAKFIHATLTSGVPQALMTTFEIPNPMNHAVGMETPSLLNCFRGPIKILNEYLDDQASNPTSTPAQSHHEFLEWYTIWKEQFKLAVTRFLATFKAVHMALRDNVEPQFA